jgi:Xaa-Pro aminopeptidase
MHECSPRIIQRGDLVSFDTDLIGPYGYCADISRCYVTDTARPTKTQRHLYQLAYEQIEHNVSLLKAGVGFRELAEKAWPIPDVYAGNRYSCIVHGVGLCDEYPNVAHLQDFEHGGYDGVFAAGMTVCAESYIGRVGGLEGVKLEQQVLLTETGAVPLSSFPFDDTLLGRQV